MQHQQQSVGAWTEAKVSFLACKIKSSLKIENAKAEASKSLYNSFLWMRKSSHKTNHLLPYYRSSHIDSWTTVVIHWKENQIYNNLKNKSYANIKINSAFSHNYISRKTMEKTSLDKFPLPTKLAATELEKNPRIFCRMSILYHYIANMIYPPIQKMKASAAAVPTPEYMHISNDCVYRKNNTICNSQAWIFCMQGQYLLLFIQSS